MTITPKDTFVVDYKLARKGVNLYTNPTDLDLEEAIFTQNCVWRNGVVKRGGQTKFEADEVAAGKKVIGLHRFYYSTSSKQLLTASGTVVRYHDGATWQDVKTGLTDGSQTYMSTWLDSAYVANTDDAPHKWDGSSDSAVAAAPADTKMFLPYQDRLLSITGGDLTWSAAFDDTTWGSVADIGVRPDTQLFGMIYHSVNNGDSGYEAQVLLAGANGMYLFSGRDLRWPSTTGDYSIYPLANSIGCNSPRTMAWTPKGSMWLGVDRQVYLLPFHSSTPIPIGHKVQSNTYLAGIEGIEDTPSGQIQNACAAYHNGYYILSLAESGQSVNNVQWWLDVDRLYQDDNGYWGPWYGPMKGQSISCFAVQSGNGDEGQLMGGESNASTGSFVYQLNQRSVHGDVGTAIDIYYQTIYHHLSSTFLDKDVHRIEAELLDVLGTVSVEFQDISGSLSSGQSFGLSGTAIYWDDAYWGEQDWSSSLPTRQVVNITPAIQPRRLSVIIQHSSSNDKFELYALRVEATEQNKVFG